MSDQQVVAYTVKELLAQLQAQMTAALDRIERKIDDQQRKLEDKVEVHERRLVVLEQHRASQRSFAAGASLPVRVVASIAAFAVTIAVAIYAAVQ